MAAYLISRTTSEVLDTTVFSAGPKDNEEAVLVFTSAKDAQQYIDDAGWQDDHTVATVESIPFLKWLMKAYDEGVQHLAVDPKYVDQASGTRLNTLDIEGQLEHAGNHIVDVASPDF